ncbi:MAG: PAS domain S-box protein [Planctomycetes bacterium]|nr:PAS domain S-box protein [Planctomycetota bacterium]
MSVKKQTKAQSVPAPSTSGGGHLSAAGDRNDAVFRSLVEAARCMLVILRPDRTVAYFNEFAAELTGYTADEAMGKDYFETFVPKKVRRNVEEHFCRALDGTLIVDVGYPLQAKNAPIRWVVCSFRSFGDYREQPAVLLTAQDITIHRHTEKMLQRRTHDLGERIKELNCLFGLSKLVDELGIDLEGIFRGLVDILPPAWQYPEATCGRVVFGDREFTTYNFRRTEWRQAAPIVVHGSVTGAIEVYYLQKKPSSHEGPFLAEERRLLNALAEQLGRIAERKTLEKEISEISTREQQRIGRELHDGLGQELTGLGYLAETLVCDLQGRGIAEADTANDIARGIERALDQASRIARGLVPVEIDADGLMSALQQLAASTEQRCDVACRFDCRQPVPVGDAATAMQLFRIAQEAVNNSAKHARASEICIELHADDGQITLQVQDDGVGIPDDLEHASGMGLRIMQYRAGVIGATLNIECADGTAVTCRLPRGD